MARNGARFFRLWQKKRGGRRTGSPLAGSLGEATFYAGLMLFGAIALGSIITSQVINPTPEIYSLGYGFWLLLTVLAGFIIIGVVGVITTALHAGASVERRSALVRKAADLEILSDAMGSPREFPCVPRDADLTNSPGVAEAFRLPIAQTPTWHLTAATISAFVLTAVATVFTVLAFNRHSAGEPDWYFTLFVAVLDVGALWAIRLFLRQLNFHSRLGPTCVEISDHPLYSGGQYGIFVSQTGRLSLRNFTVSLVCEEEATYQQGTDIRAESRVVFKETVSAQSDIRIDAGTPLEFSEQLTIPAGAMHSFQSAHNAVRWRLVVEGDPERWPGFVRSFPVIVYPTSQPRS